MAIHNGDIAELHFQYLAEKEGFIIAVPHSAESYDFIIDTGEKLLRVQVKSSAVVDSQNPNSFRINTSKGASNKTKYTKAQVDVFAVYLHPLDMWYFFPFEDVGTTSSLRIYPFSKKDKHYAYRYNWDIFTNCA